MTVKELEAMLGMTRANIRYYEQENLIKPMRQKNGYRDYSEQDILYLKKIKLLRELGVPLADIKKLQSGELSLPEEMQHRLAVLGQQNQNIERAKVICMDIQQEGFSYQQLDADRYLNGTFLSAKTADTAWEPAKAADTAQKPAKATDTAWESAKAADTAREPAAPEYLSKDIPKKVPPACRFLARAFDMIFFQEICICALSLCHINYRLVWTLPSAAAVLQLFWLFLEPLLIHFTGTTAGKWLFGIYLTDMDGRRLSYRAAFWRTLKVYFFGMGFNIPILSLYCLYKSYQTVSDGRKAAWDDETEYLQKHSRFTGKFWQYLLPAAVCASSFVITCGCILYAQIPVNRGSLTLEEFVENYNQTARFLGYTEYFYQLKPDGTFYTSKEACQLRAEEADLSGGAVIDLFEDYEIFDFSYSFDGECLKQIALHIDLQNYGEESYIIYPRIQMAIAVHAFAGAQDGIQFWKNERVRMMEKLMEADFAEGFSYQMGGMDIVRNVKCSGFGNIMDYLTADNAKNQFFLEFAVGN